MNKVVVFDLDDTLYKEIDFLKSAYREIAAMLNERYGTGDVYDYLLRTYYSGQDVFGTANKEFNVDIPLHEYLAIYRNHIPQIILSPEAHEVMEYLSGKGVHMGILTDGRTATQENKIRSLGLDKYIPKENQIISERFGHEKPSREGYLLFENKYPECSSFYYVGDNTSKDFKAPNELGWISFCLRDKGENIHKQDFKTPAGLQPTHILNDIRELYNYI